MNDSAKEGLATHRYFDREYDREAIKLLPNEYFVSSDDVLLTTVLGSCVAACVRDPVAGVGGMNHFMLPDEGGQALRPASASMRYGAYAMEVLLNALFAAGAKRERLEAKVFGGGMVLADMTVSKIGERNAEFILRYLELERIRLLAHDLKDKYPRRVNYFPLSGQAMVKRLKGQDSTLQQREKSLAQTLAKSNQESGIELFGNLPSLRGRSVGGGKS